MIACVVASAIVGPVGRWRHTSVRSIFLSRSLYNDGHSSLTRLHLFRRDRRFLHGALLLVLLLEGEENSVWRHGKTLHSHARRIVDGVGERSDDPGSGPLASLLGAERALRLPCDDIAVLEVGQFRDIGCQIGR